MIRVGYARVSTDDQNLDRQLAALEAASCSRVFEEKASGKKDDRPKLAECLDYLREGDTLVVTEFSRLGRSMVHLVTTLEDLDKRGVKFMSLKESIDTETPAGRLMMRLMAALAEFEREMIVERSAEGRKAARAKGVHLGRPPTVTPDQAKLAQRLYDGGVPVRKIAEQLNVKRTALYNFIEIKKKAS